MSVSALLAAAHDASAEATLGVRSWAAALAASRHDDGAAAAAAAHTPSLVSRLLSPPLPPLLAPLPALCRAVALLIVAPIVLVGMLDFAWYAVFRTLGLRRRRVRVRRSDEAPLKVPVPGANNTAAFARAVPGASPTSGRAPVLTPGAYDADTLLRHRARSASAASADAEEEWLRTGGQFARVTAVRAAALASGASTPDGSGARSPLDSPGAARLSLARASGVGVEGALGYFDTDAEESGTESGRASPVASFGRASGPRAKRAGSGFGALGFTPVSQTAPGRGGSSSSDAGRAALPLWGDEGTDDFAAAAAAAAAADLEPELATT